jgi:hypothetical protein
LVRADDGRDGDGAQASAAEVSYLARLLDEINRRRDGVRTARLLPTDEAANRAVDRYLVDLVPLLMAAGGCFHGTGDPVRPGWDYVADAGFPGEPRGEVLACPGSSGVWTPARVADGWLQSPPHRRILYEDATVQAVACGVEGQERGGATYRAVACVTYLVGSSPPPAPSAPGLPRPFDGGQ